MSSGADIRLQEEVMRALNEIDKGYLRKMQAEMHKCAAACCEDTTSSMESVQRCIVNCGSKVESAQRFVQNEFSDFQDRLSRCHKTCSDKVRDEISGNPSEADVEKYKAKLNQCAEDCAETHIKVIGNLLKRTKAGLSQQEFRNSLM